MGKVHIVIKLRLKFYNEYFVGGGKGSGMIDSYILKDHNGMPYIPASSIKGRLRYNMGVILKSTEGFCGFEANSEECNCIVCRLFGKGGNSRGMLYFEDLKIEEAIDYIDNFSIRTGIAISRYTKKVKNAALYTVETGGRSGKQSFAGEIEGYLDENEYQNSLVWLYGAFKLIYSLGGNQSRGLGWLDDETEFNIYVNGNEITTETLMKWGETLALQNKTST